MRDIVDGTWFEAAERGFKDGAGGEPLRGDLYLSSPLGRGGYESGYFAGSVFRDEQLNSRNFYCLKTVGMG